MRSLLAAALLLISTTAYAGVDRFAIFIGNNLGDSQEQPLQYAVSDAEKMFNTLVELGDVPPQQAILSTNRNADDVRRMVIDTNRRIRERAQANGRDSVLFVYYSGHGDSESLHLGGSNLPLDELRSLVLSSSATVRVLVLDSCRSGPVPRVKGGRPAPGFELGIEDKLHTSGAVLVTASAANEDAQESDELRGSFFTHHFASALLGAGDTSGDGQVSLEEAYAYAYAGTVRSSSRAAGKTQHPSFHFDVMGMDDIVLTRLAADANRGTLVLSAPGNYVIFAGAGNGALVAEVTTDTPNSSLALPPGDYMLRKRAPSYLREGVVRLKSGTRRLVKEENLAKIDFARVVRKGGTTKQSAHSLSMGLRRRGEVLDGLGGMSSLSLRYNLAFPHITLSPEFSVGQQTTQNQSLIMRTREYSLGMRLTRDFDWQRWTFSLGVLGGAAVFTQDFTTDGIAPSRFTTVGTLGVSTGIQRPLFDRFFAIANADLLTYVMRETGRMETGRSTPLTFSLSAGIGAFF